MIYGRRPFTEMFEVLQNELIREAASGEEPKYKGMINQVYLNDLPSVLPERYIKKEAFITTIADYTTGTVTVNSSTNIVGTSTSWTSGNSGGLNLAVSGYNQTYRVNYVSGTSLDLASSLAWTEASGSGLGYTLSQDRYAVASDFSYLVKDDPSDANVVYRWLNNSKIFLTPLNNEEYDRRYTGTVTSAYAYTLKRVSGVNYIYVQGNPDVSENIGYQYIPVVTQLRELTDGTASVSGASGTAVSLTTTSSQSVTASLDTTRSLYFRNDADGTGSTSKWAKISSISDGTSFTLSSVDSVNITTGASLSYTIAEVSEWPERFDDAMIYKAAWVADPDSVQAEKWLGLYTDAINQDLTVESKRKRAYTFKSFPGQR